MNVLVTTNMLYEAMRRLVVMDAPPFVKAAILAGGLANMPKDVLVRLVPRLANMDKE